MADDKKNNASKRKSSQTASKVSATKGRKKKVVGAQTAPSKNKTTQTKATTVAVLPLRDIVVFPTMIAPLFVGREKSVAALDSIQDAHTPILLLAQKDSTKDNPSAKDLYQVGTLANILQLLKLPDGTVKLLVEGEKRVRVTKLQEKDGYFQANIRNMAIKKAKGREVEALGRALIKQFILYARMNRKISPDVLNAFKEVDDLGHLADLMASHLILKVQEKQEILELDSVNDQLERIFGHVETEIDVLQMEKKIRNRVKKQMEKTQRDYYLNEQLKAIQKELGEKDEAKDELDSLKEKIDKTKLSKEAREKANSEFKKLRAMSPMSAESNVIRNYLDWLLSVPWKKKTHTRRDLVKAEEILNADHYGLEKVKERVVEYLAVQMRSKKVKGPILCLVGPPGVGKTSLARSIARSTERHYVRMSLGGVRDEAEIRGHRRTYIGAMPGKIIQGMKKAEVVNPLFLLDEIDKLGADFRGDPASALLEVLDPEQNKAFVDHYLEVDYDLSNVMFITTANSLDMPQPLLDRMEVIRISGYTEDEKMGIARTHLIEKQMEEHSLHKDEWTISDAALRRLIQQYTREAGVRHLERELARLCRKAVKTIVTGKEKKVSVTIRNLKDYAGIPKFAHGEIELRDMVGIVTGLAWTRVGGEILTIESVKMPGKPGLVETGKLGDVMKESITAAFSFVKSRAPSLGIDPDVFDDNSFHVHVPEGAVPKDGPSAGVGMVTSLVSVLTNIPVKHDVAMTGEVTLRGRVLAIGGLKEKLLAAVRAGIKTVFIPKENEKDIAELPDKVKENLTIVPVSHVDEVLNRALVRKPEPLDWEKKLAQVSIPSQKNDPKDYGASLRH